jgi:hypothetical protein
MTVETENTGSGLGSMYNEGDTSAPTVGRNLILKELPGEDSPLIVKLVPDLGRGKVNGRFQEYWEVREHGHISGIEQETGRPIISFHPCQKILGEKVCPECDKYYDLLTKIKLAGGKETPQGKELQKVADVIKPRKKGWILFVTPDSDVIKAFKAPESLINLLWGKPKRGDWEEIPSLIEDMRSKGMSPYDLRTNPMGWIAMYKTGKKLGTKYFAKISSRTEIEMVNGRPAGEKKVYTTAEVSDYILNSYDLSQLPDIRQYQANYAFTMDESIAFAKNPLITPQRIVDMFKKEPRKLQDADENADEQSTAVENVMATITAKSNSTLNDIDAAL